VAVTCSAGCSLDDALNANDTATDGVDGAETAASLAECAGREIRVATYNVESVNEAGSTSYEALAATLRRIDADIVCMQEIVDGEAVVFGGLAAEAGYPYVLKADRSPGIGGELSNGCFARYPMDVVGSWSAEDLSPDPSANDVGRDLFTIRVDVSEGTDCHVGVIAVHAKSGSEPSDWFRRQVEALRLAQAVALYRELHPQEPLIVVGDFNERLDEPALGTVLSTLPTGLPPTYQLGSDITLPLTYQPFTVLTDAGLALGSPSQEDTPDRRQTWRDSSRLDYIWLSGPEWIEGEVYNSCLDDGVDAPPQGDYLQKAGEPLACSVSDDASDHFAVVADLRLP